jgi:hypothetical protein
MDAATEADHSPPRHSFLIEKMTERLLPVHPLFATSEKTFFRRQFELDFSHV